MKTKRYDYISGFWTTLPGSDIQRSATASVIAVTDPSREIPRETRIITGKLGGDPWFGCDQAAARRLALTLLDAARDVDAALPATNSSAPYEDELVAIVMHDVRTSEAGGALTKLVSILKAQVSTIRDLQFKLDDAEGRLYDEAYHKAKAL